MNIDSQTGTGKWVNLLYGDSVAAGGKIVGVARTGGGTNGASAPFFSCGVTFISPQYAVTAAHCVPNVNGTTPEPFEVQHYNTTSLNTFSNTLNLLSQAHVTGTYPAWTRVAQERRNVQGGLHPLPPLRARSAKAGRQERRRAPGVHG